MNKGKPKGTGSLSDNLPEVGSYFAMRRYCLDKGVKTFSYDEFEDRLPRPKGKNEPRGAKIIVRKGSEVKKKESEHAKVPRSSEEILDKGRKSTQPVSKDENSQVGQLERELLKLLNAMSLAKEKTTKSGISSYQDLLVQIFHKLEELIKIDPAKAKSPLTSELQKAYERLRTSV